MYIFIKTRWIFPLLSLGLFAQQNFVVDSISQLTLTKKLDEVVVVDSRFPIKKSQSGKQIIKINSETLSSFQGLGLSAILKRYVGIEILGSQSYAGQNKTISIRGGRNRQVLILIDGIRVSDPSRIDNDFNLNFLNLDQIESIEILKGASSTLYGSSASTGVISIQTKKVSKGFKLQLQSILGSDSDQTSDRTINLFKNNIYLSHGSENFNIKTYISNYYTNGMSSVVGKEVDPFYLLNFGTSLRYGSSDKFNLTAGFDRSSIQSDYDNAFPLEDANYILNTNMNRFNISPNLNYENGEISLCLGHQIVDRDFVSDFPFQTLAKNTQLEFYNKYIFGKHFYTIIGALYQNNYADYDGGQMTSQSDFYGNVVTVFSDQFRINAGVRFNSHDTYGNHFTYSINPSYQIIKSQKSSLKGLISLSTAFIAPSLYQLYDVYSGNIDLKPEENKSFESGFVLNIDNLELAGTYFQREENPSLIYDLASYRYENANQKAVYSGFEFQFSVSLDSKLKLNHQLTYTESENGDLRYLPKLSSQTELNYFFSEEWQTSLSFQSIGKRLALDNETFLKGYDLLSFSIQYDLKKTPLRVFLHATNLFNTQYIEIEGYSTRGRNILVGLNYLIS